MLCGKFYLRQRNLICNYIHWTMIKDLGSKVCDAWTKHTPKESMTIVDVVVTYDKSIITDWWAMHNKQDIVRWDKKERMVQIINVAVPMDWNVVTKIAEKITDDKDLKIEMQHFGT